MMSRKIITLFLFLFTNVVQAELPKDVVFLMLFDQMKGDEISDLSGHGNNGIAVGKEGENR